ncbi:TerD family protein [Cereibacter sphaeroides]|uniref:TerD family protein n=1 Tax=Cereibacter sphaeroides TaxID=1063 RepID=UPI001F251973|nr:TerD family protein [Cereibacter sphaeroides]MCE6957749.1 TerD family protein [Cereibacter sphaeroides]MCE6971625.1 TerD family protein [Cereibacter sphaeroides]
MSLLAPGANAALAASSLALLIRHGTIPGAEIDVSAFLVGENGKVRGDGDMCFYGQPSVENGACRRESPSAGETRFQLDLARLPQAVAKVVLTATIHENRATFGRLPEIAIEAGALSGRIPCAGREETALILAEVYRRNGDWKLRIVGQGFKGGLAPLATHLGVDISPDPAPAPAAPPAAPVAPPRPAPAPVPPVPPAPAAPVAGTISLSKVSLTKESRTISLKKDDGRYGKIRVNLNWNQGKQAGLMNMFGQKPVDLDLGCFVEDRYGNRTCVQALGGNFGDFGYFPYAKLLGDDRTGAVSDGEWLEINGEMWKEFNRLLVFAFIYDGVPNWQSTDGTVRIMVPGQPEIEVRMNEHNSSERSCAVALLENEGGRIKVSREVKFFRDQEVMDHHYGWGMRWRAGSK